MMRFFKNLLLFSLLLLADTAFSKPEPKKILVYSYTQEFRHQSIEDGVSALTKLAEEKGYAIVHTEKTEDFNRRNLKNYALVVFLHPTGSNVFNNNQKAAFKKFIHRGGGFLGIHAATDCNYEWEWYGKLAGAYFTNHPKIQEAKLNILDKNHIATQNLPDVWIHTDEWYNFKDMNPEVKVLISVDEKSYSGGNMHDFHPISWYHEFEGGKAFYTALGHTKECYTDATFLKHLSGALDYLLTNK